MRVDFLYVWLSCDFSLLMCKFYGGLWIQIFNYFHNENAGVMFVLETLGLLMMFR